MPIQRLNELIDYVSYRDLGIASILFITSIATSLLGPYGLILTIFIPLVHLYESARSNEEIDEVENTAKSAKEEAEAARKGNIEGEIHEGAAL